MKILLDNVNLKSSSGPNHFGNKIKKYLEEANDKENPKDFRSALDGYL